MSATADRVRPFVLLSDTRRRELREAVLAATSGWRRRWSTASDHIEVVVSEEECATFAAHAIVLTAESAAQGVLFRLRTGAGFLASVLGVPFMAAETTGVIAQDVQSQALKTLCEDLLARAGIKDARLESSAPDLRQTGPCISVIVHFGRSRPALYLEFSPQFVSLLAPMRVPPPRIADLAKRRQAIGPESVRVAAFLGDVEISLADLARLEVGDVIVLDRRLTGVAQLSTDDGKQFASAAFGSSEGRRAVSVVSGSGDAAPVR